MGGVGTRNIPSIISEFQESVEKPQKKTDRRHHEQCISMQKTFFSQEEADTRIFLHVADAVNHGNQKVMIRTVDTDVLVLVVAAVQQLLLKNCGLLLVQENFQIHSRP